MKRLFLLLLLASASLYAQNFRFAVWGDSQFQNPEVFEETVLRTELLKPDFVLHVGDMIHGYTYSIENARKQWIRFKKQIEPLTVPFYPTPGNHDVTTKEIQPAYLEAWGDDKLYYSFDYQNSHFIVLNAFLDQKFDTIPPVQMDWLKNDLEKAKTAENIFVTVHSPLYLNAKYKWDYVHELLKKYPVKAVFTGHHHIYDYRVVDGIKYYCLNSSGNMDTYNEAAGRSHHFLWITVKNDVVDASVITKNNFYREDYILPGESSFASRQLEKDGTIIINDPYHGIDTTIFISLSNKSTHTKHYQIVPVTGDFRWSFPVSGYKTDVDPGKTVTLPLRLLFSGGEVKNYKLPAIEVTTEYFSQNNKIFEHRYCFYLFNPPHAEAVFTGEEITLDGQEKEISWKNVVPVNEFYTDKKLSPAREKTAVKILYDHKNIYLFVKGEEPAPGKLSRSAYGEIPLVFGDDDFELFFDTNRDLKTFFRLMVNPAGTVLCSGPKGLFSFNFDVKTFTGKDFWSAEFKIPLEQLNFSDELKGSRWGFNIRRHRQQAEIPQSDWSKMNNFPPYQPEYFGILEFK